MPSPAVDRARSWLPDVLGVAGLVAFLAVALSWTREPVPAEDAAILMRYAQHLAGGHGIVWNVGEAPVEGATDFLFLVVVSLVMRVGLGVQAACWAVVSASHVAGVLGLYGFFRRQWSRSPAFSFVPAAFVALGPGLSCIASGFGTTFYALIATGAACFAVRLMTGTAGRWGPWAFALVALSLGLTRPDGVFLAIFLLAGVSLFLGWRQSTRIVATFGLTFLVLGGTYFCWRWRYFGYPLPLTYYRKGGGHLFVDGFFQSWWHLAYTGWPLLLPYAAGLLQPGTRRWTLCALVPIAGFTSLWCLMSPAQNYYGRFQYALLPVAVVLAGFPLDALAKKVNLEVSAWARAALALAGGLLAYPYWATAERAESLDLDYPPVVSFGGGLATAGQILSRYSGKGYVLATTEAGLLPLYSRWRTIDLWGLNDPQITRQGGLTPAYLDAARPTVILLEAHKDAEQDQAAGVVGWDVMVATVRDYARSRGFRLAGLYGPSEEILHVYYVRSDCPDCEEIFQALSKIDEYVYLWGPVPNRLEEALAAPDISPFMKAFLPPTAESP